MKVVWRICGRFYLARSRRAYARGEGFQKKAESFFQRVKGHIL